MTMATKKLHFETLQLHVGQEQPDPATDARAVPIYQTTSYVFHNAQHAADRFGLRDAGNIYGRLTNSTQGVFEARVAALEGGVAGLAVASGAAAVTYALQNIVRAGDHIIAADNLYGGSFNLITHTLASQGITNTIINVNDLNALEAAIRENTKAIVCTHASNLTGNLTDMQRMGELARRHGLFLIVDASQTAGVIPIDVKQMHIDVLCFTGHKSLFGPQGTGGLYIGEGAEIKPLKSGGTGVHSFLKTQPEELPEHLEAGTLNGHGIAGLLAGVQEIQKITAEEIWKKERNLMECFVAKIKQIPNVKIYGDFSDKNRCPIVSLNIAGVDSSQVSEWLLEEYEIAVRPGAHCAPLMHQYFGTQKQGMVRFSFSYYNTEKEALTAAEAIREIAEEVEA